MVRLHLVGFTTDLKNLIFSEEQGTKAGFVVSLDSRLRNTLQEVARLEEEADPDYQQPQYRAGRRARAEEPEAMPEPEPEPVAPAPPPAPKVSSKLTPKEIQLLLRQGKTEEQVARLAQTKVDWIRRFSFAILAERRDVIDAVRAATLSKPRLGLSGMNIGEAVEENLGAKRLRMGPEAMDDAWRAVRKNGRWHVSFEYESRGQKRMARYSFDPANRLVEPLNEIALELGWRADPRSKASSAQAAPSPRVSGSIVQPTAARSSTSVRQTAGRPTPAGRPASGSSGTSRQPSGSGSSGTSRQPSGSGSSGTSRQPSGRPAAGPSKRPPAGAGGAAPVSSPRNVRASSTSAAGLPVVPVVPRVSGVPVPRSTAPGRRTPLPRPEVSAPPERRPAGDAGQTPAPGRRAPLPPEPGSESTPASTDPQDSKSGGFTIGKPKADRPDYSSLPKVWRPSRRP